MYNDRVLPLSVSFLQVWKNVFRGLDIVGCHTGSFWRTAKRRKKRTAKQTARVPAEIETVRRRFEPWRTQRRMPDPIPVRVGDRAVRLAQDYGVSRISKTLRVGYYPLKERVERQKDPAACGYESPADVTFVEREPPATSPGLARLVEWEDSSGAKMRCNSRELKRPTWSRSVAASGRG